MEDALRIREADLAPDGVAVEPDSAVDSAEVHEEKEEATEEMKEEVKEEPSAAEVKGRTPEKPKRAPLGVASTNSPVVNPQR